MGELMTWLRPLDHFEHRALVVEEASSGSYRRRGGRTITRTLPEPLWLVEVEPSLGVIAEEARMLGLLAHGAATPVLRELFTAPAGGPPDRTQGRTHDRSQDAPNGLVRLVGSLLPQPAAQATFGSDLTAVVTGPPTGELSALLDSCADREGRGGAATWRFSTASVRRALDAGVRAEDLETRLAAVSRGELPQPLTYLLGDVSRRHGAVRVFDGRAVLRSEDVELLAQIVADASCASVDGVGVRPSRLPQLRVEVLTSLLCRYFPGVSQPTAERRFRRGCRRRPDSTLARLDEWLRRIGRRTHDRDRFLAGA